MLHARKDYDRIQDPSGKIGQDEPVFLLRAKDELAPICLILWAEELIRRGGDKKMANMVAEHAAKMIDWQEKNGCRLPDLPVEYIKKVDIPAISIKQVDICYKTNEPCKYGCEGLCKESC